MSLGWPAYNTVDLPADLGKRGAAAAELMHEQWRYRELLAALIGRDLRLRYKQSVVGIS